MTDHGLRFQNFIVPYIIDIYSPNKILVEKLRSILQRGRARDYYDVWRLLKEKDFDQGKIGELLIEKCQITGVDFKHDLFFNSNRLSEAKKFWIIALARLTRDLPDFELVVKDLKSMLDFIPEK